MRLFKIRSNIIIIIVMPIMERFSSDVTVAMSVFRNKEMAVMILRGLNSIFMQILSFVSVIQYGCWSRE